MKQAIGIFGDQVATELIQVSRDPSDLDHAGLWAVTQTFEGDFIAFEFANVTNVSDFDFGSTKVPQVDLSSWIPGMSQTEYEIAVESIRQDIARGWVYQANLCYLLTAQLNEPLDPIGLWQLIAKHNQAPYLSALYVPRNESGLAEDVAIVSASPELFISRDGDLLTSSPIKGTAKTAEQLLEKDRAENVMIVDLIRNDLSHVAISGTVEVPELLRIEEHPGLVHLVSDVQGLMAKETSWTQILQAMAPPGSVSGAPKSSALEVINRLEKSPRQIYCGAFGYVNANSKSAKLAVGIRTFWQSEKAGKLFINFGTGAGITWGSDPASEWAETQLKAQNLLRVASLEN